MKRVVFCILIISSVFYTAKVSAEGVLREGGKSLIEQNRKADLESWLMNVCGSTKTDESAKVDGVPTSKPGDVYFVGINHYWKGSGEVYSVYNQINKGVDKIEKVKDESKLTTSSGTFYTYEAKNANKFFFIVRRDNKKTVNNDNHAFRWYDEWSYVEDFNWGYTQLEPCYGKLKDGAPFFSPHNCDTSLGTNHYITLNDVEDDSPEGIKGYNFTAFLYVPEGASETPKFDEIGSGEEGYRYVQTLYVYNSENSPGLGFGSEAKRVSTASQTWYMKHPDGYYVQFRAMAGSEYYSYSEGYPVYGYDNYKEVAVYTYGEKPAYKNAPYVFFYTVGL